MPYLLLSDSHLHNWNAFSGTDPEGRNERLMIILDEIRRHGHNALAAGITTMYHAGDLFHTRGRLTPSALNPTLDTFRELIDAGLTIRMIPGNHDLESNTTDRLTNATAALEGVGVKLAHQPTVYHDDKVVMFPWVPQPSALLAEMKGFWEELNDSAPADRYDAIIHAPVNGVIFGIPDHGLSPLDLADVGFRRVFAGHYHDSKHLGREVYSVGATTHQTWSDPDTLAGALVVGDEVIHHESKAPAFVDLNGLDEDEIRKAAPGNYVRLKVGEATEADIKKARQELTDMGAKGVLIASTPASKVATRTGATISSGARIEQSIAEWIDANPATGVDQKAVEAAALDVLKQADEGVEQ